MKLRWRYSFRWQGGKRSIWEAGAFVGSVNVAAIVICRDGRWSIDVIDDDGHATLGAAKRTVLNALEDRHAR